MKVQVINKSVHELPEYSTIGAAGLDVKANLDNVGELKGENFSFNRFSRTITLLPGGRVLVPTGLFFAIPEGMHIDVRPRSGLALKQGITVLNTPGLIDEDYRGELGVVLINLSPGRQTFAHGERIAQIVLTKHEIIEWDKVDVLSETVRGEGGFGHTGKTSNEAKSTVEKTLNKSKKAKADLDTSKDEI